MSNCTLLAVYNAARSYGYSGLVFTGGEPLLEPRIVDLVELFRSELTMITTNGSLLSRRLICDLNAASLNQLNISLSSTDRDVYAKVTKQSECDVESVKSSISSAVAAGIRVQVNSVVFKGLNDDAGSMSALLEFSRRTSVAKVVFIKATVPDWYGERGDKWSPEYERTKDTIMRICAYAGRAKRGHRFTYHGDLEVVLTECTDTRMTEGDMNNRDFCVDIRGYLIPTQFRQRRVPVVPSQPHIAVESTMALLNNGKEHP